ncbi:MAG: cytochrome c maturation protein CcmE [Fimbriimonas sp.]|nr:cytochrome c maturation protein CcmE [Fimbriimonas sp.]
MKKGPIITAVFTVFALGAVVMAFLSSASPFVTIAQAKQTSGDQLHIAGDVVKNTLVADARAHVLRFELKDENGDTIMVRHTGEMPSNLAEVKKVVAIGGIEKGEFVSNKLLVKCPSKYEAERKVASN